MYIYIYIIYFIVYIYTYKHNIYTYKHYIYIWLYIHKDVDEWFEGTKGKTGNRSSDRYPVSTSQLLCWDLGEASLMTLWRVQKKHRHPETMTGTINLSIPEGEHASWAAGDMTCVRMDDLWSERFFPMIRKDHHNIALKSLQDVVWFVCFFLVEILQNKLGISVFWNPMSFHQHVSGLFSQSCSLPLWWWATAGGQGGIWG